MRPGIGHRSQIHVRVVHAQHAQAEDFIHVQQMPEVGTSEMLAGEAAATFLDGTEIRLELSTFDANGAATLMRIMAGPV